MLPSTGYFKGINCAFYDSGLCERPYCHFRHVKRDTQSLTNDGIESGAMLQQLVSEAVKKVLQHTEASVSPKRAAEPETKEIPTKPPQKVTYNPTPISELKKINTEPESDDCNEQRKRHIPVPYTPRKPASLPIKRHDETNGDGKPFIYIPPPAKYLPGSNEGAKQDPYLPKGGIESTETYLPGSEKEVQQYKPVETKTTCNLNYVPSGRNASKKKLLEYKPAKVSSKNSAPSVTYQPTPRSQVPCFSSEEDDDEPDTKKRKISNDLNGLDELGDEFDILGQILDEEKLKDGTTEETEDSKENKEKNDKEYQVKSCKDSKSSNNSKSEIHISVKIKAEQAQKEKVSKDKDKSESKIKGSEKISSKEKERDHKSSNNNKDKHHKSSNKDKVREQNSSSKDKEQKSSSKDKDRDHKSSNKDKDRKSLTKDKDRARKKERSKSRSSSDKKQSSTKSSDKVTKSSESSTRHSASTSSSKSIRKEERNRDKKEKHSNGQKSSHKSSKQKNKSADNKHKLNSEYVDNSDNDFDDRGILEEELCEEESESDEEAIALECKKIFEEYVPMEKPRTIEEPSKEENNTEYIPTKKRISRTVDKNVKVIQKEPIKPDFKVSAVHKMAARLPQIREFHAARNAKNSTSDKDLVNSDAAKSTMNIPTSSTSTKIRIAHVPYASTMMNAKKTISRPDPPKVQAPTSTTIQTVKKGVQRVAHMPNEKFIDRPGVLEPLASRIPANIRSTYLNMMIDECLKIYLNAPDAYARAQHEELATSKKCKAIQIYKNSAVLTVSRLRKEILECNGVKKSGMDCTTLQNLPSKIKGTSGNAGSWSIENKFKRTGDNPDQFSGAKFYENISKWVLTEEQLQDNGFPRPHPCGKRGKAMIYTENKRQEPPKGIYRTCGRCKKEYTVDKRGFPTVKEECIYHPNRKYKTRGEAKYQCCSQDGTSDGCCVAPYHVYEYVDYDNLNGYVKTLLPEREMDNYGVYSLDCEMCYTTQGLDLTRITVINTDCKVVYETLIRPLHPIIDYNTRYSGITEEQMVGVKTTLLDVQATLLTMFNSKTILIGHSLESDCKALKLIHDTVIDTSVLFPHKMGPPYKRALRNLTSEYLKKIIQNSVDGHDSAEDATVCMELLQYKLREDLKTR